MCYQCECQKRVNEAANGNEAHAARVAETKLQEDARAWEGIKTYEKYVAPRVETPDEYRRRMADYGGA